MVHIIYFFSQKTEKELDPEMNGELHVWRE
jgi:hypothetical protein